MNEIKEQLKEDTSGKRLEKVIEALGLTANSLGTNLGYRSSATIYHVINGINKLSPGLIEKIIQKYPNVNYSYLKEGEGEILLDEVEKLNQMHIFNIAGEFDHGDLLPQISEKINTLISLQQRSNELQASTNELLKDLIKEVKKN